MHFTCCFSSAPPYFMFPSPHSGILFLFEVGKTYIEKEAKRFRPLIRGFFFYKHIEEITDNAYMYMGFRPLIRGFFFYPVVMICRQV